MNILIYRLSHTFLYGKYIFKIIYCLFRLNNVGHSLKLCFRMMNIYIYYTVPSNVCNTCNVIIAYIYLILNYILI